MMYARRPAETVLVMIFFTEREQFEMEPRPAFHTLLLLELWGDLFTATAFVAEALSVCSGAVRRHRE